MKISEYQKRAAQYKERLPANSNLWPNYPTSGTEKSLRDSLHLYAGLMAEVGELAAITQKCLRGHTDVVDIEDETDEIGDVLWYLSVIAETRGYILDEIAENNLKKLERRHGKDES